MSEPANPPQLISRSSTTTTADIQGCPSSSSKARRSLLSFVLSSPKTPHAEEQQQQQQQQLQQLHHHHQRQRQQQPQQQQQPQSQHRCSCSTRRNSNQHSRILGLVERKSVWNTFVFVLAAIGIVVLNSSVSHATISSSSPPPSPTTETANFDIKNRNDTSMTPTNLPSLGEEDGDRSGEPKVEDSGKPRWVRVISAKAAHPAMYVPGDGLVYCPIAKVACAEWRKTLRWMLGIPDWDTGPIHEQGKNGIPLLAGKKAREVEMVMNDDSWLKFVVVRDPADRLLSGFLNKCIGGEWQNCPYVEFMPQRFKAVKARNEDSDAKFFKAVRDEPRHLFRDFVLGVRKDVREQGCRVNSHWRPQYCFCSLARFLPHYHVIPFSNMSTEAVALVDRMTRPSPERADLLREFLADRFSQNYDAKQQGAETKRERFFSKEALDVLGQVYNKDYILFAHYFVVQHARPL